MACFVPGTWSGFVPPPGARPRPRRLTDQTVEAGDLVPRCNKVGRTLGWTRQRQDDRLSDGIGADAVEGEIRDLAEPISTSCSHPNADTDTVHSTYNHAQQRLWLFLTSDESHTRTRGCGLTLLTRCPLQTEFSHHPVITASRHEHDLLCQVLQPWGNHL